MKTKEDLTELIDNLDITIGNLESEHDVDMGGCLWVCYVLARNLEERNINYKVVVYVDNDARSRDLETILRNQELWHMSISISGREIGKEIPEDDMRKNDIRKFTTTLMSDEILGLYGKYDFNQKYDRKNDKEVETEIDLCFNMVWDM